MNKVIDYFHKTFYPDMRFEDVANAINSNEDVRNEALAHMHENHYPDLSAEEFMSNVKPTGREPILVTNPNNKRLRAYNDSLALYKNYMATKPSFWKDDEKSEAFRKKQNAEVRKIAMRSNIDPTHVEFRDGSRVTWEHTYLAPPEEPTMAIFKKPVQPYKLAPKDMIREDGTLKGKGFLGNLPNAKKGQISSELSISVGDVEDGKDVLIPTMIPTLTQDELNHLLNNKYNPSKRSGIDDVISRKAIDFARQRKAKGLPYFATKGEEGKFSIQKETPKVKSEPVKQEPKTRGKFYQGRQFIEETGLRPNYYTPEEVSKAKARQDSVYRARVKKGS